MRVREVDQECEARVVKDPDGTLVLCVRPGLLSTRAYVSLTLALSPLVEHQDEHLQRTG